MINIRNAVFAEGIAFLIKALRPSTRFVIRDIIQRAATARGLSGDLRRRSRSAARRRGEGDVRRFCDTLEQKQLLYVCRFTGVSRCGGVLNRQSCDVGDLSALLTKLSHEPDLKITICHRARSVQALLVRPFARKS
ncbi:hypothetical protein EVAR_51494_1 [Eumeta japonica]|uniref:Uncharacterized protein n=1 Tax=Eumeta variegata TaxID=151549 RepID=A0A4C1XAR8_EUMVA|nr:hypothetical protein EVAR_51494_1 [Eumeta japonica]